jgi:HD-GYP domain-containing protein (c-di-GMP phosphodiesterase class II)
VTANNSTGPEDDPVARALRVKQARDCVNAERLAAALLETLLNAVDATDPQTGAHVRRVARYALVLADAAGLDEHAQHDVERVALFHDVGKIHEALFDIIHDHRKLSAADRRAILTHPQRGVDVLAPLEAFYPTLSDGVLSHHERWDGTGYPRGLAGEAIPLSARIVAIADSFDAITFSRRYHSGRSAREALDLIADGRGAQFDPELTDLFLFPPIVDEIVAAMKECGDQPPPGKVERRHGEREVGPDVTFRWRHEAPPQRARA